MGKFDCILRDLNIPIKSTILVFDRESLGYLATFSGEVTRNTDGIWLEAAPLTSRYPEGVFFAVHDDGNIAAFDFSEFLEMIAVAGVDGPAR